MKIRNILFLMLGLLCLTLGSVGIFIPLLPSAPFYILTVFCFANSSKRLHSWFLKTDLYKKYVSACLNGEGMHKSAKRKVMLTLTILMGIGFFFMAVKGIWIPCLILILVWIGHLYYFMYRIKTKIDETDLL